MTQMSIIVQKPTVILNLDASRLVKKVHSNRVY